MKMTLEYSDIYQMIVAKAGEITVHVIPGAGFSGNYAVRSSTGLQANVYTPWELNEMPATPVEKWLFKCAYEFWEIENTRLQEPQDVSDADYPQIG